MSNSDISKALTRKPGPDSVVSALIDEYLPPVEPFPMTLSRGQVLYFKAVQDSAEWAKIKREVKAQCDCIKAKKGPLEVWKAASNDHARNALAVLCWLTMSHWFASFEYVDDELVPDGEQLPKWELVDWLKFADKAPVVFDGIASQVDQGQVVISKASEARLFDSEKKD